MSFTEEEKRAWHEAKRQREARPDIKVRTAPVTECIHCGQAFGYGEGSHFRRRLTLRCM